MFFKRFAICCVLLASSQLYAGAKFSNFIFFGDSLTDIGNMPAASHIYVNPKQSKDFKLSDYTATFYVPVSNPVNRDGDKIDIEDLFPHQVDDDFSWPNVVPKAARQVLPAIDGKPRKWQSMLWPEFLIEDAHASHILQSHTLIPRAAMIHSYKTPITINDSIDYAWASALAGRKCSNVYFKSQQGLCTLKSIQPTWQRYTHLRTKQMKNSVRIPGLRAQVKIFIKDLQTHKVHVNDRSAVFIWIGGNDMSKDFAYMQKKSFSMKLRGVQRLLTGTAIDVSSAITSLARIKGHPVRNVYVLTMFNPRWSPRVMHWPASMHALATIFTDIYNAGLRYEVWTLNRRYPLVHVRIIPVRNWFDHWAHAKGDFAKVFPAKNLGDACQMSNSEYNQADTPEDNCMGYMFWNAVHPSMPTEQLLGYKVMRAITK